MKKFNSLSKEVKASLVYTICGIITKCISFLTLPLFTRLLTTEEYGLTTIYNSTLALFIIFTSLQLPYGSFSTAMIKYKNDRWSYLWTVTEITGILSFLFIIITSVFDSFFVSVFDIPGKLFLFMAIEMFFSTIQSAWMGVERFEFKYKSIAVVTIIGSLANVIFSLLFVNFLTEKGVAKIFSNFLVVSVVGVILLIVISKKCRISFNFDQWKFALTFNLPLLPYYLSQVIFNQSDRLMINKFIGKSEAAIYGVAYSLATVLTFVVTSIHNSYTPWLYQKIDNKDFNLVPKISFWLSFFVGCLLMGIVIFAPEIISVMAGASYIGAIWVVPPVALSVLLLYYANLFDCLLFFFESKFFLVFATIISGISNLILNYLFIPKFGYIIAAYTTLLSYLILALIDYIYLLYTCKQKGLPTNIYNFKKLGLLFGFFVFIAITAMLLYKYFYMRVCLIAIGTIFIAFNYHKLTKLINIIKER